MSGALSPDLYFQTGLSSNAPENVIWKTDAYKRLKFTKIEKKKDVLAPPTWRKRVSSCKTLGTPGSPPTVSAAHQKAAFKRESD